MTGNDVADAHDRLPDAAAEFFGEGATAEHAHELLTVDVPAASWISALETARDRLGCTYFDWLSAVDEPGTGFRVCAHVVALTGKGVRRLLIRTTVPHEAAVLPTAVGVYAGAAWHERETHEMFGIGFEGHPHLVPLLLPEGFEGHPLRKDFVLAARVAKAWPGAKEPGESEHGGAKRRTMLPPGVPDPNEWGPLKGQLPPAPSRPARTPRAAGDRPVRRSRSASEGSAGRRAATAAPETGAPETGAPEAAAPDAGAPGAGAARAARPRRNRSASQGSASQHSEPSPAPDAPSSAPDKPSPAPAKPGTGADTGTGTSDAPWHHARPAFDPDTPPEAPGTPGTPGTPKPSEAPGAPGTPETPGTSETSEPSEAPETSEPSESSEAPGTSEPPEVPETSEPSEAPGTSGIPEAPRTPRTSESTESTGTPETPGAPETPDTPAGGDTA
ncbi:NADH-quinone oxidoreductase subunit C [Streptomyces sp. NPDC002561]|uniref:NADH-quinone oxidoreductase subunit C n=1 Tax=Streptomyces sp. NPDC002561 TaxID=3154418 RepID=UPI003325D5DD